LNNAQEGNVVLTVFLSYAREDHIFAELADMTLAKQDIKMWRDQGQLRAGTEWRHGIEKGIADSLAVLVALSTNSSEASYVTFEWAYALGMGKVVIPMKLNECKIHPRLTSIQYLDFSIPGALPWPSLVERIREIETDGKPTVATDVAASVPAPVAAHTNKILTYLNQRGYQMASFDRLRRRVDKTFTDEQLNDIITKNPTVFTYADIEGNKPGLKLVP
jgi:hypothetical protein